MVNASVNPQRFRGWIAERLGLHFDDTKLEYLAEVLERRAAKAALIALCRAELLPAGGIP
jgi:hypothetical protein